jgi:hypothetical protein
VQAITRPGHIEAHSFAHHLLTHPPLDRLRRRVRPVVLPVLVHQLRGIREQRMSAGEPHGHRHRVMIARHATNVVKTTHNATVASVEPVLGPADDTVTFFQPRGLVFVTVLWVIAAVWLVCRGIFVLVLLAFGIPPTAGDIVTIPENLLVVPVVSTCVVLLVVWRRLGWLHSSMHGLEFAATGRKAIRLPWSAVSSVALRHRGPFTELIVTPTAVNRAQVVPGPGRRPRTRRRGAEIAYLVDVGLMSPGPDTLLAELHRRIPSKV